MKYKILFMLLFLGLSGVAQEIEISLGICSEAFHFTAVMRFSFVLLFLGTGFFIQVMLQ